MRRGGRTRPALRGRGRKMPGGGRTCGGMGQPSCPGGGGGYRRGGRTRPAPRGRRRMQGGGGGSSHNHPFSSNVQQHWGQYPGGQTRGTHGYSHSHMKRGGRTRPVPRGRQFQAGGMGGECPVGTQRSAYGTCIAMDR